MTKSEETNKEEMMEEGKSLTEMARRVMLATIGAVAGIAPGGGDPEPARDEQPVFRPDRPPVGRFAGGELRHGLSPGGVLGPAAGTVDSCRRRDRHGLSAAAAVAALRSGHRR